MAHCYICDKQIDEVSLDYRDMKPRPCTECESIIADAVEQLEAADNADDKERDEICFYPDDDEPPAVPREADLDDTEW